jgi:hypothetical protein
MAVPYARGRKSFGFCDRCGFRCKLDKMRKLVIKGDLVDIKVCEECFEQDQPQLHVGEQPMWDPQALQFPRPDNTIPTTRGLFGWSPVASQNIQSTLNSVTIGG